MASKHGGGCARQKKEFLRVLVASELAYVHSLQKLRARLVTPLELQDTGWKRYLFNKPDLLLFTSLFDQILHLNQRFKLLLEKAAKGAMAGSSPVGDQLNQHILRVTDVFRRFGPLFEMYCQYASVQQGAYAAMMKGMRKERNCEIFVKDFEKSMHSPTTNLLQVRYE